MSGPALYVRLLGRPEVVVGADVHAFRTDKRYLLLAYLAHDGEWVERARLARLFWPEHDVTSARHNLRQLIKRVGAWEWSGGLERAAGPSGERLRWRTPTDLADLRAAIASGRWADALRLHGGEFLSDLDLEALPAYSTWAERQRSAIAETLRRAFTDQAASLQDVGEHAKAAHVYAHLVEADDLDEAAVRAYMGACLAQGDRARALVAYDRFAERLAREFELTPANATESLARSIRSGEPPDASRFVDRYTGSQPLANARDLDVQPPEPAGLVGRGAELGHIRRSLALPECRMLSITGPGGVGKSALARQAAIDAAPTFEDGHVYVELAAAPNSAGLLAVLRDEPALAVTGDDSADPAVTIGDKRLLLVLDDLDEFRAHSGELVELLRRCPNLVVLTTTRERLEVTDEWVLPLEGLSLPDHRASSEAVLASDSVRLFLSRVWRVRPGLVLEEAEVRGAARVCRLVAGLPLAIELAAAWARALPFGAIADQIEEGLDLLSGDQRGPAGRHSSMRASIDASWRRLPERERRDWRSLAVFRSSFGRAAAKSVAGVEMPRLAALIDRSLVRSVPDGSGPDEAFSLHPLLRSFAAERLAQAPDERADLEKRHADYFLGLVDAAYESGSRDRKAAVDALAGSTQDLVGALTWTARQAASPLGAELRPATDEVLRWIGRVSELCDDRGWYELAAQAFQQTSAILKTARGQRLLLGSVMAQRAWHLGRLSRADEADATAVQATELLDDHRSTPAFRTAVQTRAYVALHEGRYADAAALFTEALGSARASRSTTPASKREIAKLTGNLAVATQMLGDRRGALRYTLRQLAILEGIGDDAGAVACYNNLGNLLRLLNRQADALDALEKGLRLANNVGHTAVLPSLHVNLGVLHLELGSVRLARQHFEVAVREAHHQGRESLVVNAKYQLGRLELKCGSVESARTQFSDALELASKSRGISGALDALAGLAWVEFEVGSGSEAVEIAALIHRHSATSPGTRRWMSELLAMPPRPRPVLADAIARGVTGATVARAMELVAEHR